MMEKLLEPLLSLWRKKLCHHCQKKLHRTWDQCPYCGQGRRGASVITTGEQRRAATIGGDGTAPAGALGWIIPMEGAEAGKLFTLRGRATIGTARDNEVAISDTSISGHHAELIAHGASFRLSDLGSTNGTFVNDKPVSSHELVDNDTIRLGALTFKFKSLAG